MPKASVKRLIECKKKDLIDLVLDIEKYPGIFQYPKLNQLNLFFYIQLIA